MKRRAARIGLFYGSTTGATRRVAESIASSPLLAEWAETELLDVAEYFLDEMADFDLVLIGQPTWNTGQLQRDWQAVFDEFDALEIHGLPVALFALGDQVGYPDTFVDALAFFADKLSERGATLVGRWPAVDYTFRTSWALGADGCFPGLVLDEESQPELTDARLARWLLQVRSEFLALPPRIADATTAHVADA